MSRDKALWWVVGILAGIFIFTLVLLSHTEPSNEMSVRFLAVGQGDSTFIETPAHRQILIDGGPPSGAVLRELGREMPFFDRSIDVVIASHPDLDHIGGLLDVLTKYDVDLLVVSGAEGDSSADEELLRIAEAEGVPVHVAKRGQRFVLDQGVGLDIIFPDRDASDFDSNDSSIIARLVYGETSFLFTGDSPKKIEDYLVSRYSNELDSDVLKVGHHGSRTSTGDVFLSVVSPEVAIIQAGKDNSYGHPHAEVTELLSSLEIPFLVTSDEGTIRFLSDAKTIYRD